ncbi:hypothetical protein [Natranaerobius trueperi]|uniref:hypothetical protein n=1 Tax=Natranaerobius trueperi TaxID=759412 RepID=UPI001F0B25DC
MGDVIGDLDSKRGKILGMDLVGENQIIKAYVPKAEVQRYAIDLRSIAQGRIKFKTEFSHYQQVPEEVQEQIIEQIYDSKG